MTRKFIGLDTNGSIIFEGAVVEVVSLPVDLAWLGDYYVGCTFKAMKVGDSVRMVYAPYAIETDWVKVVSNEPQPNPQNEPQPIYNEAVTPLQAFNEAHDHQLRIALVGGLRSGKTTAANYLVTQYGLKRVSFADKLKYEAERMFSSVTPLFGATAPKPRELLVRYGQAMRSIYPNIFVAHARNTINYTLCDVNCAGVVIDDLRQPNEYQWLRDNGFTIIRISSPESLRIERAARVGEEVTADNLADETESYVNDYEVDFEIYNVGTKASLACEIDRIVSLVRDEDEEVWN